MGAKIGCRSCTSTYSVRLIYQGGRGMENLWSRMGVVLADGVVERSYSADAGTRSVSLNQESLLQQENRQLSKR